MPISEINIGDHFENPLHRPWGCTFIVIDINKEEKMIKVQTINGQTLEEVAKPFWKSNKDRMFSEHWRVFNMKQFLA